jgi:hypothetical protein
MATAALIIGIVAFLTALLACLLALGAAATVKAK